MLSADSREHTKQCIRTGPRANCVMVQAIETGKSDLVALKFTGSLDKEDYTLIVPSMEEKIDRFGKISLYWEMDNVEGWEPGGLWEDLKFDIQHTNNFNRIAIVGDRNWENWITKLMKPFTSAEVKYFDLQQREEAMAWVRQ
ncbi:hypothetical protein CA264_21130 (plasmid) [Pontibacter actiniarum]|uniref:STAS/SEC14 domain-containing protein n=2 Tax=Hymenobacteraceae TaxID=1853232 RepID=A0A1X9YYN1_9BACT|nr:hypothetical protein CA264_21130 [Pontibacter actiniarum]